MEEVLRLSLENNPDLQSAQANYQAASEVIGESVSNYLPHVDAYGISDRTTLPSPSAGSTALLGLNRPYTEGSLAISQTLFDFGRGLQQIEASQAHSRSVGQQLVAVRNVVELSAQRTFYDVAASEKLVEVAQKSLAEFQETYRRTQVLVQTGVRPSFDLSQAQVELSKAELALINSKNARDLAKIALLNVMGMRKQVTFALVEPPDTSSVLASQLNLDKLTQKALRLRPEIKRDQFNMEAIKHELRGQERDYMPTLAFNGWYGKFLPSYPAELRGAWGLGLGARWNIFSGLNTTFRIKELAARVDEERALLRKEEQGIVAEVASSYMNLVRAEQNDTVAGQGLDFAKQNFHFAKLRYDANVGTILELLVAETSLVNAEAVEVEARYRHAVALAALERAVNAPLLGNE